MIDYDKIQAYLSTLTHYDVSEIQHPDIMLADELHGHVLRGDSPETIQDQYPFLSLDDISTMLFYAEQHRQALADAEREFDEMLAGGAGDYTDEPD